MTALQQIIKEAKVIWKKHPKLSWQEAIKKASTIYKSKHKPKKSGKAIAGKRMVKKSALKKSAPKKVATKKSTHKDTKSHNVRINVVSGISEKSLHTLTYFVNELNNAQKDYNLLKIKAKNDKNFVPGQWYKRYPSYIVYLKKQITEAKKHIK